MFTKFGNGLVQLRGSRVQIDVVDLCKLFSSSCEVLFIFIRQFIRMIRCQQHGFFFQMKLLSHQLGRTITKRLYKEAYTQIGESPSAQYQENEITYIAFWIDYLMKVDTYSYKNGALQCWLVRASSWGLQRRKGGRCIGNNQCGGWQFRQQHGFVSFNTTNPFMVKQETKYNLYLVIS